MKNRLRKQLDAADIPYDQQSFNPHITLIRKPILPREEVLTSINVPPASMIVKEVCLYQSIHEADGMKYTVIGRAK
jgi:2'-5' RNA ligase